MDYPNPLFEQKICSPAQLEDRVRALPRPLVFTNGCFDILHRGHVTYLAQAQALGASLIVALNDDQSVKNLGKAPNRPVNVLANRLAVVAALESVQLVTWFTEATPLALIQQCQPDILVKGGDWTLENIVGADFVLARGGQVYSIPFLHRESTTQLIEKIQRTITA